VASVPFEKMVYQYVSGVFGQVFSDSVVFEHAWQKRV
jgi:hypothetical protein